MNKLNNDQWEEVKHTFDTALRNHGMGNGYIILCRCPNSSETAEQVKLKIDGLVLPPKTIAILGKLAERAASHYDILLNRS